MRGLVLLKKAFDETLRFLSNHTRNVASQWLRNNVPTTNDTEDAVQRGQVLRITDLDPATDLAINNNATWLHFTQS